MPPTVESVTVTELTENATSITVTEAAGASNGDLLLTFLAVDTGGAADIFPVGYSIESWTPIPVNAKADPAFVDVMVEYRIRGTNPTPNLTWDFANAQQAIAIMYRISGHDENDPIGAFLLTDGGFGDLPLSPEIVTEADDSLVLRLYAADGVGLIAAEDGSYPENHTGRAHRETSGPGGITAGAADEVVPVAGFSNVGDWPSLLAEVSWHAISIEIKAAPVLTPITGTGAVSIAGPTAAGTGEFDTTGVSRPAAAGL